MQFDEYEVTVLRSVKVMTVILSTSWGQSKVVYYYLIYQHLLGKIYDEAENDCAQIYSLHDMSYRIFQHDEEEPQKVPSTDAMDDLETCSCMKCLKCFDPELWVWKEVGEDSSFSEVSLASHIDTTTKTSDSEPEVNSPTETDQERPITNGPGSAKVKFATTLEAFHTLLS